jgi:Flp pilus assembly protein CpaB
VPPGAAYRCGVGDSLKSLNPSLATRISQRLRPDWSRTLLARRIAAAGLVVLAGVAALRPDPDGERVPVVVAAHDLSPGAALSADDLLLEKRLVPTIPDGTQSDIDTVVGSTLAGPARRGEVLTDVRLLGRRLAESAAGPGARIVPVHPVDSALADLVRPGDVVDIVAASQTNSQSNPTVPGVIATDAIVVLVSAKQKAQAAANDRVVLVALPAASAIAVAGAALGQTVTLTLH